MYVMCSGLFFWHLCRHPRHRNFWKTEFLPFQNWVFQKFNWVIWYFQKPELSFSEIETELSVNNENFLFYPRKMNIFIKKQHCSGLFLDLVPTSTPLKFLKNWVSPFFSWVLWKYLSFVGKLGTEFFESRNWVFRFCSKNKPAVLVLRTSYAMRILTTVPPTGSGSDVYVLLAKFVEVLTYLLSTNKKHIELKKVCLQHLPTKCISFFSKYSLLFITLVENFLTIDSRTLFSTFYIVFRWS